MHSIRKLRTVPATGELLREGRYLEGQVVALEANGKATFRDEVGTCIEVRVPRSVDKRWLTAAVALVPVPAIILRLESSGMPVLAHVFSAPEHEPLDDHFRIEAKTIDLAASESVRIRTGRSIVTVSADGEIRVRGKNITSRATNLNRVRGGGVRLN
jgi:hypothetical protein